MGKYEKYEKKNGAITNPIRKIFLYISKQRIIHEEIILSI